MKTLKQYKDKQMADVAFAEEYEAVRHFTARHIKSRAVGG